MTEHEKIQEMIRQKEQAPIALDPGRTALVIVDVQRFFTRPDSEFAQVFQKLAPGAIDGYFQRVGSTILPKIQQLQHCFRSLGLPVIFCVFGSYAQDGQDLPCWLKDFDKLGLQLLGRRPNPVVNGASWQVEDAIAPLPGELIINKTSSGALSSTNLDQTLHNMGHYFARCLRLDHCGLCRPHGPTNRRPWLPRHCGQRCVHRAISGNARGRSPVLQSCLRSGAFNAGTDTFPRLCELRLGSRRTHPLSRCLLK